MTGYLGDPAATAATIDADGWLHTGDLGHFDDDGFLYLSDRLKDLIKVKGFQVAPAELEALLRAHPAVADAAVVGRLDAEAGERPVAFVVAREALDVDELRALVDEQVAPYKRLREIEVIEALPRSPTGKLLRRALVA
jgi:acyl-CoA synthetase (AMP-forming)/AMP-acid ligase II